MSTNGQKTSCTRTMYLNKKENKRLHTLYKKYVHKEKKEMTHVKIGESHISTNINPNISTVYVKWSQDQYT